MESYDDYTVVELFQLLDIMERECFPTGGLYKRKNEIIDITAKRLDIEAKEVAWLLTTRCQRKESEREDKIREKAERDYEEEKRWKILTREIVALGSSVNRMGENIRQIKGKVVELEKSYRKLALDDVQENGEESVETD